MPSSTDFTNNGAIDCSSSGWAKTAKIFFDDCCAHRKLKLNTKIIILIMFCFIGLFDINNYFSLLNVLKL